MIGNLVNSLSVTGKVAGSPCEIVVDTGSNISIVRPDILRRSASTSKVNIQPVNGNVRTVTGDTTPVRGKGKLKIRIGSTDREHECWVADIENECIIGLDFLTMYDCIVNVAGASLRIGSEEVQLRRAGATSKPQCRRVVLVDTYTIPPRSEALLPARLDEMGSVNEAWGSVSPTTKRILPNDVLVGRTLVDLRNSSFPVRVANVSDSSRTIRKGTELATCEMVESVCTGEESTPSAMNRKTEVPSQVRDLYERSAVNLDDDQKVTLRKLLCEFSDVFSEGSHDLGRTSEVKHTIDTGDARPIRQPARRLPLSRMEEASQLISDMSKQGIIEPSSSPWTAPVVLVKKKDGSSRFCVDYRKLNEITKKDSYPLPRIDTTLDAFAGSSWFSTLDLKSGYWQVELQEEDREKTAFTTGNGLWQFVVMPFGLCNAPATFERLIELVLVGLPWSVCLVYLDDIIVHAKTFDASVQNLQEVFRRLRSASLKLNPDKCELFQQQVSYLGHLISAQGVSADPSKVRAVTAWPIPKSKTELRSFLGLCSYYRKFVRSFADIAKPLHKLTEKDVPYVWSEECDTAFQRLKYLLTSTPILGYPTPDGKFIIDTDASEKGIGAVLSQEQNGQEKVIAYFSRTLSRTEQNYCVTRRELLAMVKGIEHFHYYLYGRRFTLRTDHASLRWLLNFRQPEGQIARWLQKLQEYDFEIQHRLGRSHGNADALSRRPCDETDCTFCLRLEKKDDEAVRTARVAVANEEMCTDSIEPEISVFKIWSKEELIQQQTEDPDIGPLLQLKSKSNSKPTWGDVSNQSYGMKAYWAQWESLEMIEGIMYRRWEDPDGRGSKHLLVVPKSLQSDILHQLHSSRTAGHLGVKKTAARVHQRFYWTDWRRYVQDWCKKCDVCATRKGSSRKRAPLKIYNVGYPMERVAVDVLGPLPKTESGNEYILIAQDYFTKWVEAFALPNQQATTVAEVLVNQFFCRFGVPMELHSDQGRNFESAVFQEICKLLQITKTRTSPYHPESDGMVERFNRTLENGLTMFVNENQTDWDQHIPLFLMAYRTAVHVSTKVTPSKMMLGREMRVPIDLWSGKPEEEIGHRTSTQYAQDLEEKLERVHVIARKNLEKSSAAMKRRYDSKVCGSRFDEGVGVWLHCTMRKKGKSPKIMKRWDGPYVVINHLNDVIVRIQRGLRAKPKVVHVNRLKPYHGEESLLWYQKLKESRLNEPCSKPHRVEQSKEKESKSEDNDRQDKDPSTVHENTTSQEGLRRSKRTRHPPKRFGHCDLSGTDNP